jgi:hypothetical protein
MRTRAAISIIGMAVCFAFPQGAHAQWVQTSGPPGGQILSLALSGTRIFAGTAGGGVFRSDDNGTTWKAVNSGFPPNTSVSCLAVSKTKIFAGTWDHGVFVSADNGASWTAANLGLTEPEVYSLAITGPCVFAGLWQEGIFLSTDGGTSWTPVNSGLASEKWGGITVYCLLASGTNIYAGTNSGLYLSRDYGASWKSISSGMRGSSVHRLAASGPNLVAINYGYGGRVYLSANNGASWTEITSRFPAHTDVECFAVRGTDFLAGTRKGRIFLSADNGKSWRTFGSRLPNESRLYCLVAVGTTLFAGTPYGGVFRSIDNGSSWRAANQGLVNTEVRSIAARGTTLFAGGYLTVDGGATWTKVSSRIPGATDVSCLAEIGKDLFAGTGQGVFLSRDEGTTWKIVDPKLKQTSVYDLAVNGTSLFAGTENGVLVSTDSGASWKAAGKGLPAKTPALQLAVCGNDLFAVVGKEICTIFGSRDNGASWTEIKAGPNSINGHALAVSGKSLYVATQGWSGTLFVRGQGLKTFQTGYDVICSADGGSSWADASSGLPAESTKGCFEVWGPNIFVGTWGAGVFFSTDGGASWTAVNSGLMNTRIRDLAVCGDYLYAGTHDGGVWRLRLSDIAKEKL